MTRSTVYHTYIGLTQRCTVSTGVAEPLRVQIDRLRTRLSDHTLQRVSPLLEYPSDDGRAAALVLEFRGAAVDPGAVAAAVPEALLFGDRAAATTRLRVRHGDGGAPGRFDGFAAIALFHLQPGLRFASGPPLRARIRALPFALPLLMGIVNVTPDSFSDGGRYRDAAAAAAQALALRDAGAHIVDVGAESTRPGAAPLSGEQEWARLAPALERIIDAFGADPLRPRLSVDTYHPSTAARALELGVDMINDVGGLSHPAMCELAAGSDVDWVAMHQLTLPADRAVTLALDADPVAAVAGWFDSRREDWLRAGIDDERLMLDPGIGFGKRAGQSLRLLRDAATLADSAPRLLIGHSRKSFLDGFAAAPSLALRDQLTVGASLALCARPGVDALRVHDVAAHVAALRGWSQLQPPS